MTDARIAKEIQDAFRFGQNTERERMLKFAEWVDQIGYTWKHDANSILECFEYWQKNVECKK